MGHTKFVSWVNPGPLSTTLVCAILGRVPAAAARRHARGGPLPLRLCLTTQFNSVLLAGGHFATATTGHYSS